MSSPAAERDIPDAERTPGSWRRWATPVLLLAVMVLAGWFGHAYWSAVEQTIADLGFAGYLLFYGVFVLLTVACMPVSIFALSAGALFGPLRGLLVLYPAALTSALVMYVLAKSLLRRRILGFMATRPRLLALDRLAGRRATRLNVLARLSPLNYGVSCYTLAVGRSSLAAYVTGLLGIVPSTVAQVWLGSLGSVASQAAGGQPTLSRLQIGLLVAGLLFFGVLSWQVGRLVQQAWRSAETAPEGSLPATDER